MVVAGLVLGGCQWAMYGFGPGRTGSNPAESTIGLGNVAQLQLRWTAPVSTSVFGEDHQIVVANNLIYAAAGPDAQNATVKVFDALGVTGCAGTPKVCAPLWTYALGRGNNASSPVVVGGTLYVQDFESIYAFDAGGTTGCGGSPKVCQPLWSAPGVSNRIVVDGGKVFVFDEESSDVLGYDAAGSNGCSGSPKVCAPVWRGTVPACAATLGCGRDGALMAANGRLYEQLEIDDGFGGVDPRQAWFDEAGSVGCSGSPPICVGTLSTFGSGGLVAAGPGGAHGSIISTYQQIGPDPPSPSAAFVVVTDPSSNRIWGQAVETAPDQPTKTRIGKPAVAGPTTFLPVGTGIQAWAVDQPTTCTTTAPSTCQPLWHTTGAAHEITLGNGVLYDDVGRAYDAAGSVNCSGTPKVCAPIAQIGPTTANTPGSETEIVNGWVYRRVSTTLQAYHLP